MEITDIIIRNMNNTGKLKAVVSCTFDHAFVVHDIKIIESQHGLFIAMPSRRTPNGNYIDIAHPIHTEFRNYLSDIILERYHDEFGYEDDELVDEDDDLEEETYEDGVAVVEVYESDTTEVESYID